MAPPCGNTFGTNSLCHGIITSLLCFYSVVSRWLRSCRQRLPSAICPVRWLRPIVTNYTRSIVDSCCTSVRRGALLTAAEPASKPLGQRSSWLGRSGSSEAGVVLEDLGPARHGRLNHTRLYMRTAVRVYACHVMLHASSFASFLGPTSLILPNIFTSHQKLSDLLSHLLSPRKSKSRSRSCKMFKVQQSHAG